MDTHVPVLLDQAVDLLAITPTGVYVDATLGRGGHTAAIASKLTTGLVYGIDQDLTAIRETSKRLENLQGKVQPIHGNFAELAALLAYQEVFAVDGILYDLGVSSPQFDNPERGFSYRFAGPLDMRMNPDATTLTAATVVNTFSESELSKIFWQYGQEKYAAVLARAVVKARPLHTTLDLVDVIKANLPQKRLKELGHPAKKVFQALRIYVNNELGVLEQSLTQALGLLKPGGRVVVITFHSLEEQVVKAVFKAATRPELAALANQLPIDLPEQAAFALVLKKPVAPTADQIAANQRAHSAKLWAIEKRR